MPINCRRFSTKLRGSTTIYLRDIIENAGIDVGEVIFANQTNKFEHKLIGTLELYIKSQFFFDREINTTLNHR